MVPAVRAELCGVVKGVAATPPGLVTVAIAPGDSRAPHAGHELAASGTGRAQRGQRTPQIITRLLRPSVAEVEAVLLLLRRDRRTVASQHEFLDLAGGRLRQLGNEGERVRRLEVRQALTGERAQLFGADDTVRIEHDEGVRGLTPFPIRQADDGRFL